MSLAKVFEAFVLEKTKEINVFYHIKFTWTLFATRCRLLFDVNLIETHKNHKKKRNVSQSLKREQRKVKQKFCHLS